MRKILPSTLFFYFFCCQICSHSKKTYLIFIEAGSVFMKSELLQKCQSRLNLKGEVYLAVYPDLKVIHIDITKNKNTSKSFFCDYCGHIVCPHQINSILKKSNSDNKLSYYLSNKISLIFIQCPLATKNEKPDGIYLNLSDKKSKCILKLLYSSDNFSLGVIEQKPDHNVSECLKLIPEDMQNWSKMVIEEESFRVFSE